MAEQHKLHLTVAKIDGLEFEGEVESVVLPGIDGEMTLMAHHEPLISPLTTGTITINISAEESQTISMSEGTLEVSDNKATVLI